jgi:hypothetical protein
MTSSKNRSDQKSYTKAFESFGVAVRLISNEEKLLNDAIDVARRTMLGNLSLIENERDRGFQTFELMRTGVRYYRVLLNGEQISSGPTRWKFLKFFDGLLRVSIGEHSSHLVFIHAGAVAWNGRAILLPANSFDGKSTLVTELVKLGAVYYSDEFAIIDKNGLVHPFARPINRRTDDDRFMPYQIDLKDLGAEVGSLPIPCGMILFTEYEKGSRFRPNEISIGEAIMEFINYTLSIRVNPEFTLRVLNKLADDAILLFGRRPEAKNTAKRILDLIDKSSW